MIKIAFISDIHLGILDPDYQISNLDDNFFSVCDKEKFDIIVVGGDISDERVSMDSGTAAVYTMFIDKLIATGSTILVIEGTKSHDENQINTFAHRVNSKFRIYSKVATDTIHGLKMLLIPEEYMSNPDEYYKPYLKDNYDCVFGHGLFSHVTYTGKKSNSFKRLTSPTWDYKKDFQDIVKYVACFGHIHTNSNLDKYWSNGSFGRYNHGEEEPKGFMIHEIDEVKGKITSRFVENTGAKLFKTIDEATLPDNSEDFIKEIKIITDNVYKLRIEVNRSVSENRYSDIMAACRNVKVTCINRYKKGLLKSSGKNSSIDDITYTDIDNKYVGMDYREGIIEYIKEHYDMDMSWDTISGLVNG